MKYKDSVIHQLDVLGNRLEGLKTSLENNKPMTTQELIRQIEISIKAIEEISGKVGLEDNDFGRMSR
jgi:hypothetical protein